MHSGAHVCICVKFIMFEKSQLHTSIKQIKFPVGHNYCMCVGCTIIGYFLPDISSVHNKYQYYTQMKY